MDVDYEEMNIDEDMDVEKKYFGENESIKDPGFQEKKQVDKEGYNPLKLCATIGKNYQWSEYKVSLLIQELLNHSVMERRMVPFLQKIAIRLFDEERLGISLEEELYEYSKGLETSVYSDEYQQYPVAQSKAWINGDKTVDIKGIFNNFYALFNFLKFVWFKIKELKYKPIKYVTANFLIVHTIQQQCFKLQGLLQGTRLNIKGDGKYDGDIQIGITSIRDVNLLHKIKEKPLYEIEPWRHSGEVQCYVPYTGKYGKNIKDYKKNDNFYGSMQCGISGSVLFVLFLYLLSILSDNGGIDFEKDFENVILTSCLIFIGDGGHNTREVIYGLILQICILKNIIEKNDTFMSDFNRKLFDNMKKIYPDIVYGKQYISDVNTMFSIWKPFILVFYDFTKDVNVSGLKINDLNTFDKNILLNKGHFLNEYKEWMFSYFFSEKIDRDNVDDLNSFEIFLGLENDRFKKKSFKTSASRIISDIILRIDPTILKAVDEKLENRLEFCKSLRFFKDQIPEIEKIPFAFTKSNTKKSKTKKSKSKKSKSKSKTKTKKSKTK